VLEPLCGAGDALCCCEIQLLSHVAAAPGLLHPGMAGHACMCACMQKCSGFPHVQHSAGRPHLGVNVSCAGDGAHNNHARAAHVPVSQVCDQSLVVLILWALNVVDDACTATKAGTQTHGNILSSHRSCLSPAPCCMLLAWHACCPLSLPCCPCTICCRIPVLIAAASGPGQWT
jgi:hypothetical protein